MVLLLPKVKGFGEQVAGEFGGGFGQGVSQEMQNQNKMKMMALEAKQEEEKQNKLFQHQMDMQKEKYGYENDLANGKAKPNDEAAKKNSFEQGLNTLNRMRQIRKGGNLGRGSAAMGYFGGQTAKDRGEYEQLGKSLISLATNIPIRNKLEFETLSEKLYDPSITDDEAEGVLNAMEKILKGNLLQFGEQQQNMDNIETTQPAKERKPLTSFKR